jgi:restriction system protein
MQVVFRYVPPWMSVPLAIAAFIGISAWVNSRLKTPGTEKLGYLVGGLIAMPILIGGIGGYRFRRQRAEFLRQNITLDWVNSLTWQEFENLSGAIFRARGYAVENCGGGGADGGVDLRLLRNGESTIVQCKRWKVFKVGVKPIRELFGVVAAEGAHWGIFVSSGIYTQDALRFAEGKPLELIDGAQFAEMAKAYQGHALYDDRTPDKSPVKDSIPKRPACPTCGEVMVLRRARTGTNAGQEFWGCSAFPGCRGTRSAS